MQERLLTCVARILATWERMKARRRWTHQLHSFWLICIQKEDGGCGCLNRIKLLRKQDRFVKDKHTIDLMSQPSVWSYRLGPFGWEQRYFGCSSSRNAKVETSHSSRKTHTIEWTESKVGQCYSVNFHFPIVEKVHASSWSALRCGQWRDPKPPSEPKGCCAL